MLTSKTGSEIALTVPRDRVLTETDAPFVEVDGHSLKAGDVTNALNGLASLWQLSFTETKGLIALNSEKALS